MIYYINESEDKSSLSKNYKKGKLKLSDFKLEIKETVSKKGNKNTWFSWYNGKVSIAHVAINLEPAIDGYVWFGSLEVSPKYRGYGLADQIIDFITSPKYKAGALAVYKDNEIAINLYKKHGFEISKTRTDKEYYYMYLKKNYMKEHDESKK